jgi:hypothetical protein
MADRLEFLGLVKLVQLQPSGLIIETPSGSYYDVARRVEVDRISITSKGIEATTSEGERVLDIHHLDHPDKAYGDDDLISIGFTAHYEAMRARFGEHMVDGAAGENIIIEVKDEIWPDDLGEQILIENSSTGRKVSLDVVSYAEPCEEFSHFAARSQDARLPAQELKFTLQFLDNGRRGFLLTLNERENSAEVQPGDQVYRIKPDC